MKLDPLADAMARGKRRIPGLSQLVSKRPDQFSLGAWPTYYSRALGSRVWDLAGQEFTDMSIAGIGANVLGYANAEVDGPVIEAIRRGSSSSLNPFEEVELAEELCNLHPWADMARYARGGGEAMAVAVRIARAATGRSTVAFCGYHGWHDWYLAANLGDDSRLDEHLLPGLSPKGVPRHLSGSSLPFRFNDSSSLLQAVTQAGSDLAAIVLEPTRGDPPDPAFVTLIERLAREKGAVFIVDEVSSGFRVNTGGIHLTLGMHPDLAVFSKALGNGYPIAAVIGREAVMQAATTSFISSTNWSERVGPVAGLATVRAYARQNASAHLVRVGRAVMKGWQETAAAHGLEIEVGGLPPLAHFSFGSGDGQLRKAFLVEKMLDQGFLASNLFYAMTAHSDEDVQLYLGALDNAFRELAANNDVALRQRLRGAPTAKPFGRLVR
ncbi:MAG: aminotransferase class III-fold pyridoxal phosphate-dependent enzyme [Thermoplasmatota archaeon]